MQSQTNGTVVFSATPKGFTTANVGTKADGDESDEGFDRNVFENTIYNAFFLLFDNNGLLRVKGIATVNEDNKTVTYNAGRNVLSIFPSFRICFLANVQESVYNDFTVNTTKWSDLEDYYFSVSYAPFSETGSVGVPNKTDLNGDGKSEYAMPMFQSKVVSAPYNAAGDYSLQLERMFAKVEILMALGIDDDGSIFTSQPQFSLLDCEILNIPNRVPIVKKTGATAYSNNTSDTYFESGEISSYSDFEYIIYSSSSQDSPTYKSLFFYVPEHKLGLPPSPGTPATQKPTLLDGKNLKAIFAKINGFLTDGAGKTYEATYSIYLGQTNNDNFDLSRNTRYINYVHLNGISNADVDYRVKIEEIQEMVDNLVEQKGETANCYIIEGNGKYMLPAYKGAYKLPDPNAAMCATGRDTVLFCDNPNITITIDPRLSKQSTIVFTVEGVTTGGTDITPETGNAVIARLNDNGEIEWSWHLWFVGNNSFSLGGDLDLGSWTSGIVQNQKLPDNKTFMMDRNIGVHSTAWTGNPGVDLGLYYQYGKKEPYINGSPVGGGSLGGETSWNWIDNKKSPTDPCPAGYRVPSQSVWEGTNNQKATKTHYSGPLNRVQMLGIYSNQQNVNVFRYWDNGTPGITIIDQLTTTYNDDIYYPYTSNGSSTYLPFTLNDNMTVRSSTETFSEWSEGSGWIKTRYREIGYTETIYSDIQYSVLSSSSYIGEMLTQNDDNVFSYKSINITRSDVQDRSVFESCIKTVYEIKQKQRYDLITWTNVGSESRKQKSQTSLDSASAPDINWRSEAEDDLGLNFLNTSRHIVESNTTTALNPYGDYQVRCIKQ